MMLNFIGKGSAFYPILGNTSSYIILEDELYLFDCGDTVFGHLYRTNILDRVKNINVIVTHLHSDHVGSLGSLISYSYYIKQCVIRVIHPEDSIVKLLDLLGIRRRYYEHIMSFSKWKDENICIRPVKVEHIDNMECYGYIVNIGEKTLYYSGDASDIPSEIVEEYLSGRVHELYQDTAMVTSPSHCHVDRLCDLFPENKRKNIYCMHLDGDNEDSLKKLGFSVV